MAGTGYRSIEILCTNDTRGYLSVVGLGTAPNCSWIQGEQATQGQMLSQYTSATWGVSTNDMNAAASGQVQLYGLGSFPVVISFENSASGVSTCTIAPNDKIFGNVSQQDTGESNHAVFIAQLLPSMSP